MKALITLVFLFLAAALYSEELASQKLHGMVSYKAGKIMTREEPILLDAFITTDKTPSASHERLMERVDQSLSKPPQKVFEFSTGTQKSTLADSPIVSFSMEKIADLKQLQGGYEFSFGGSTTTVYFKSGLKWHPNGDKYTDIMVKPPKIYRTYWYTDGEDLFENGIVRPLVSPIKRVIEKIDK